MEEATGGNVLSVIQKVKQIAEKQAAIWFRQMSDAIDYCHQRGIVHRDLKCENLLLDLKVSGVKNSCDFPIKSHSRNFFVFHFFSFSYRCFFFSLFDFRQFSDSYVLIYNSTFI